MIDFERFSEALCRFKLLEKGLMALDRKERIRFLGKVISVAQHYKASLESGKSELFENELVAEFELTGEPFDACAEWLTKRLANSFKFMDKPPQWIGEEPDWLFHNGMPMIFISQTTIATDRCPELGGGSVVYLFAGRTDTKTGFTIEYRTVEQFDL